MSDSLDSDDREENRSRPFKGGNFLFGLARKEKIKRPGKKSVVQIRFYWKRVFLTLMVCGLVGWVAGGAALYFYFKERRDYEEVSYLKMLVLPFRLDQHRKEMGDFFIEKGMQEIADGEFRGGFHLLRSGLARSPANPQARLMLARIFSSPGFGERRLAIEALTEGLRFSDTDPRFLEVEYLQTLFYLLALDEQDERRIEISEKLMSEVTEPQRLNFLSLQAAFGETELGRYDSAMRRLKENDLRRSPTGVLLTATIFRRLGDIRSALGTLELGVETFPNNRDLLAAFLKLLADEEQWEELWSQANFRRHFQSDSLFAWSAQLKALAGLGREGETISASQEILRRFPTDEAGVGLLQFALDNQNPEVAELAVEAMRRQDLLKSDHLALMGLVLVRTDRPQEALDILDEATEAGMPVDASRASGIRALAFRMLDRDEAALTHFQQFMEAENVPSGVYATLADLFAEEGFDDVAYRILREGADRYPTDRSILQRLLLEYERERNFGSAFVEHAKILISGRVPEMEILDAVRAELVSDRYLFAPEREELVNRIDGIKRQAEWISSSRAVATSPGRSMELFVPLSERESFQLR